MDNGYYQETVKGRFDEIIEFVQQQLRRTALEIPDDKYPRSTINNNSNWKLVDSSDWTSGFYPGCLWYAYEITGDIQWKSLAERWTAGIEKEKYNIKNHDIGFMIYNSFGNGYRLTGNQNYKRTMLIAAESLASRFNEKLGCIRSWDFGTWKYPVIIDSLMNLELLFWASKNGGRRELYDIALTHAETVLKNHLREDGGLYHLVDYDPETGEVLSKASEGNSDPTVTWTRGQAWGIYGYAMIHRFTGNEKFLEASKLLANNFLKNLSEDFIPFWVVNERMHKKDSSAAAIAASGLLELIEFVKGCGEREKYANAALKLICSLLTDKYYSQGTDSPSILLQGMGGDREQDTALIYGDYYFIEALMRWRKRFTGK